MSTCATRSSTCSTIRRHVASSGCIWRACGGQRASASSPRRAAERGKPLAVFKIGRSEAGAQSATSHTGAVAGTDRMYDALFKQTGAVRVETRDGAAGRRVPRWCVERSCAARGWAFSRRRVGRLAGGRGVWGARLLGACARRTLRRSGCVPRSVGFESAMATAIHRPDAGESASGSVSRNHLRAGRHPDATTAVVVVVGSSGLGDPRLAAEPVREAAGVPTNP